MNKLTAFGLVAVTVMVVCYALEERSPWFILAFASLILAGIGLCKHFIASLRNPYAIGIRINEENKA